MSTVIRKTASVLLAAVLLITAAFVCPVNVSAEYTLGYSRSYKNEFVILYVNKVNSEDTLRYTTDGTVPTTGSKRYTDSGIKASKKTVVNLVEFNKSGKRIGSLTVTIMPHAPKPTLTAVSSEGKKYLKLKSSVSGAKIYYTTDGSEPTKSSTRYKKKFLYTPGTTVRARVYSANYSDGYILNYYVAPDNAENVSDDAKAVFEIVNKERASAGRYEYKLDAELCKAADMRAKELATLYDENHYRPDGRKGYTILDDLGIEFTIRGENIARDQDNAEWVMRSWMKSKKHKAAILSNSYDYIGIGHYEKDGRHFWVQLFKRT